jgi:preprotein translocase subunit SecE
MEVQKNPSSGNVPLFSMRKLFRRFEDLKAEFLRIQWTEEGEVSHIAKVVVLATFVCGMVLYIADLIVQRALVGVDSILRLIFG